MKGIETATEIWLRCKKLNGMLITQERCTELYEADKCPSSCEKVYRKVKRSRTRTLW
jgi:hypothetical protein